jgi:hypothetical protein
MPMATINAEQIREELCHFLRYSDILSTTVRSVTRVTEGYTVGVGGESSHTFTNGDIRDFTSVTVGGTAKYFLRDYTFNGTTKILTWNTPLVNGNVVSATYDYGSTYADRIYPILQRETMTLYAFPRIGIEIVNISTDPLGIGGSNHISDILVSVILWAPANLDSSVVAYGGQSDMESTMTLIRDAIRTNAKNFYTFSWITPKGRGPIRKSTNNKILQTSQDFMIRWKVE